MVTLNISLPEPLGAFVEAQVGAGKYRDPSEYVQTLIRQAYQAQERSAIEAKLLAGLDALERGEGRDMTAQDWQRLRAEYQERHPQGNGQ